MSPVLLAQARPQSGFPSPSGHFGGAQAGRARMLQSHKTSTSVAVAACILASYIKKKTCNSRHMST